MSGRDVSDLVFVVQQEKQRAYLEDHAKRMTEQRDAHMITIERLRGDLHLAREIAEEHALRLAVESPCGDATCPPWQTMPNWRVRVDATRGVSER